MEKNLLPIILKGLEQIIHSIKQHAGVQTVVAERKSFEKWLQIELTKFLCSSLTKSSVKCEQEIGSKTSKKGETVDIMIFDEESQPRAILELKIITTNYKVPEVKEKCRRISDLITSFIYDFERAFVEIASETYSIGLAFPFPSDPNHRNNVKDFPKQRAKVEAAVKDQGRKDSVYLERRFQITHSAECILMIAAFGIDAEELNNIGNKYERFPNHQLETERRSSSAIKKGKSRNNQSLNSSQKFDKDSYQEGILIFPIRNTYQKEGTLNVLKKYQHLIPRGIKEIKIQLEGEKDLLRASVNREATKTGQIRIRAEDNSNGKFKTWLIKNFQIGDNAIGEFNQDILTLRSM